MILDNQFLTDKNGNVNLLTTYFNKDGELKMNRIVLQPHQAYNWKHVHEARNPNAIKADPDHMSVLLKPVYKDFFEYEKIDDKLEYTRVVEILEENNCEFLHDVPTSIQHNWFSDIEVEVDDDGFPDADNVRTPINTITACSGTRMMLWSRKKIPQQMVERIQKRIVEYHEMTKNYILEVRDFDNERDMMIDYLNWMKTDVNAICGWNYIGYDWKYIVNRCVNKLAIPIFEIISPTKSSHHIKSSYGERVEAPYHKYIYDYQQLIIAEAQSSCGKVFELNAVAEKVLGFKKVEHKMDFQIFYRDYFEDYCFYNCIDSALVEQIHNVKKMANCHWAASGLLKQSLYVVLFETIIPWEGVLAYEMRHRNLVVVKRNTKKQDLTFPGAFVYPVPKAGVFNMVCGLDFASLYPSCIRNINISAETLLKVVDNPDTYKVQEGESLSPSGAVFSNKEQGIIPFIMEKYYKIRKNYKKEMKFSFKTMEDFHDILKMRMKKEINN